MQNNQPPIVLAILDGWGMSAAWGGNAISMSGPNNMNTLWRDYPHAILQAFRQAAGNFKMIGNSEIGHSSIGAGKIVFQDLERISQSIADKSFFQNQVLVGACRNALNYNASLHLLGLVSDGGIHSHINHLYALLRLAKFYNLPKVYIHVITDGLDTDSNSAIEFISDLEKKMTEIGIGQIATVTGRHFAMNRDDHWENISKTVSALVQGVGNYANSAIDCVKQAYSSGLTDQFIPPTVIKSDVGPIATIKDNDSVICFNYRPDRARELSLALLGMHNSGLKHRPPNNLNFAAFTTYFLPPSIQSKIKVAFPGETIEKTLGKIISDSGLKQFRIAESEKYPHISYFFNCGQEEPYANEDRVILDSAAVKSFAEKPQMEAPQIANKLIKAIKSGKYNFLLVNFANVDSVGHSGDMVATTQAVSIIDALIMDLAEAVLSVDGALILTADHGNAEQMIKVTSGRDRESFHTLSPVPFILVKKEFKGRNKQSLSSGEILAQMVSSKYSLADIAPTILDLMGISKPPSMTGESLLKSINGDVHI
ncbi:MAG: 2,3-bisphosphoglycerate-independent phosphoglycerate mutase [Patescibacteria group bacterium]|jgi:2,3-bisphosphoglycerate-independent phosphoglycerate mutase